MKIPKKIRMRLKGEHGYRDYELVKAYPNFVMYEEIKTKARECFKYDEIGLVPKLSKKDFN